MRYVRQRDRVNCGPVLITNILKWAGNDYTWKIEKPELVRLCGTSNNRLYFGCGQGRMQDVLQYASKHVPRKVQVTARGHPTLALIDKALHTGTAAISYYRDGPKAEFLIGHYFLCTEQTPQFYTVINLYKGKTTSRISRKKMSKMLRPHSNINYMWEIQKV